MTIRTFDQLLDAAMARAPKTVAVVGAGQRQTLHALRLASGMGMARFILIDDPQRLVSVAEEIGVDISGMEIVSEADMTDAAALAVAMIHAEQADLIMNGRAQEVPIRSW